MMQQNITLLILTQKQKKLLMRLILMMYLNQSIPHLYQIYKNILEKLPKIQPEAGLLI